MPQLHQSDCNRSRTNQLQLRHTSITPSTGLEVRRNISHFNRHNYIRLGHAVRSHQLPTTHTSAHYDVSAAVRSQHTNIRALSHNVMHLPQQHASKSDRNIYITLQPATTSGHAVLVRSQQLAASHTSAHINMQSGHAFLSQHTSPHTTTRLRVYIRACITIRFATYHNLPHMYSDI